VGIGLGDACEARHERGGFDLADGYRVTHADGQESDERLLCYAAACVDRLEVLDSRDANGSEVVMSGITPVRPRRTLEQWGGLGAVAYVVLFVGGAILSSSGQPDSSGSPAKVIAYYKDSGHRDKVAIGWLIILLGVFFFLWFLGALRQFLRRIDDQGMLPAVATVGGAVYASLALSAASLDVAIKTLSEDTFRHQVYPGLITLADDGAWVMHAAGGVGAGALIGASTLAAMRAALLPRWAGIVGVAIGILAIFSIFGIPQILIAIWLLVAGFLLFRANPRPVTPIT
jgi:hypothetical protein